MGINLPEDFARTHLDGTMEGWYQPTTFGNSAIFAHWGTFLFLTICTGYLARDSWCSKGPSGKELYFAGYHEEYNISLYVNLFAMICYFGKVTADTMGHNYNNVGPLIIGLGNYRYADYMLTCPLLAYDLMQQVRAPFKVTGAILIFCVLLTGAATNFYPGEEMRSGAIAWFIFGCFLYMVAYYLFFTVVKRQYVRLTILSANTEAKKAFGPLKLALYTFFSIWIIFPIIWILGYHGLNILSNDAQECLHCACDLIAKSFYGFALARYRAYFDKKMFDMLEELGMDAEEGLQHLEKDLKECDDPNHANIKHHSVQRMQMHFPGVHRSNSFSGTQSESFPRPNDGSCNFSPVSGNRHPRRPSLAELYNLKSLPRAEDHGNGYPMERQSHSARPSFDQSRRPSLDHLKDQINQINEQLRQEYERKEQGHQHM